MTLAGLGGHLGLAAALGLLLDAGRLVGGQDGGTFGVGGALGQADVFQGFVGVDAGGRSPAGGPRVF